MMKEIISNKQIIGKNALMEFLESAPYQRYGFVISRIVYDALDLECQISETLRGKDFTILLEVDEETKKAHAEKGRKATEDFQPEVFVAIGGGSVIDAAKLLWLFYELPKSEWSDADNFYGLPDMPGKSKLIAAPTTAGTGSEMTGCAMFIDELGRKKMFLTNTVLPTYSILDISLMRTLPSKPLVYSAFDAFTHAVEASTNSTTDAITRFLGLQSAMTIINNIMEAVNGQEEAREKLLVAASFSGLAINNGNVSYSHNLNYAGEDFKLPHGLITGLITPYWIYESGGDEFFYDLAKGIGLNVTKENAHIALVNKLVEIYRQVGMPVSLDELAVNHEQYFKLIPSYLDRFIKGDSRNFESKVVLDESQVEKILTQIYDGKLFKKEA